jgi:hypothetical protein
MVGLSATAVALGYAVGAAALALWGAVRFPSRGSQTVASAVLVGACSYRTAAERIAPFRR